MKKKSICAGAEGVGIAMLTRAGFVRAASAGGRNAGATYAGFIQFVFGRGCRWSKTSVVALGAGTLFVAAARFFMLVWVVGSPWARRRSDAAGRDWRQWRTRPLSVEKSTSSDFFFILITQRLLVFVHFPLIFDNMRRYEGNRRKKTEEVSKKKGKIVLPLSCHRVQPL